MEVNNNKNKNETKRQKKTFPLKKQEVTENKHNTHKAELCRLTLDRFDVPKTTAVDSADPVLPGIIYI